MYGNVRFTLKIDINIIAMKKITLIHLARLTMILLIVTPILEKNTARFFSHTINLVAIPISALFLLRLIKKKLPPTFLNISTLIILLFGMYFSKYYRNGM